MGTPKTPSKHTNKRKKSSEKTRVHISLTPDLMRGMDFISKRLFRNRVAFVEHAIINALASEGVTLTRILELADEWEKNNAGKEDIGGK